MTAEKTEAVTGAGNAQRVGWKHTELTAGEILGLRLSRSIEYKAGAYKMQPPPVCTTRWDDEAWMNWVKFNNETLTGFLPYTKP